MSWEYVVDEDYKFGKKAIFEGVIFDTGRWGRLQTAIIWKGAAKKNELDAVKAAEAFLSKPLTREWFDVHKDAADLNDPKGVFKKGEQRGDLLGGKTWYGSSVQKGTECLLVIDCDS